MTIAALHRLLDEELPDVPRHPAPLIPHTARKRQIMQQQPSPVPAPRTPAASPLAGTTGALIAWAAQHPDKTVARLGEQVHTALTELRSRKAVDDEFAQADAEEQDLQRRLAAVQARKAELRPKKKPATPRDHDPAEVRAWARGQGIDVTNIGRVPRDVVDAWRAAQAGGEK